MFSASVIAELAFNGLALGAAYSLVALGFVVIINATGAVNFAHGDLVMGGGYAAILVGAWLGVPLIFLLPLVAVVMFGLGLALCFLAYFPLMKRPLPTVFISTLLCGIILENMYVVAFGPEAKAAPPLLLDGSITLGTVSLSVQSIATIAVAALIISLQQVIFYRTQLGRQLRAVSQDRQMAQAVGISAFMLIAGTFGAGTAMAGIAGAVLANQFFVSPTSGIPLTIYAYIAVVVGGWGSIWGAVVGAMIIALFQVVGSAFMPYTVATGALYVALIILLFIRPQGLFGERVQTRV